ncbi:hypothetical protein GCM10022243_22300 [Saccharothrix violaceirubra]
MAGKPIPAALPTTATTTSAVVEASNLADREKAVRATFDDYKRAALAKDGEGAAGRVSWSTAGYYGRAIPLALTAHAGELRAAGPTFTMIAYALRAEFDAERLHTITSHSVVEVAVEKELTGIYDLAAIELTDVGLDGDRATAQFLFRGEPGGLTLHFVVEGVTWRFDLMSLIVQADGIVEAQARERNQSLDEYVDTVIGGLYGVDRLPGLKRPLES